MDNDDNKNSKRYPLHVSVDLSKEEHIKDNINEKESLDLVKKTMDGLIANDPFKDLRKSMKALQKSAKKGSHPFSDEIHSFHQGEEC